MAENVEERRIHVKKLSNRGTVKATDAQKEAMHTTIQRSAYHLSKLFPNASELENWLAAEKDALRKFPFVDFS